MFAKIAFCAVYFIIMAKKKKRGRAASQQASGQKAAKEVPFNNPFMGLKKDFVAAAEPSKKPTPEQKPAKAEPRDEEDLFAQAMQQVTPITRRKGKQIHLKPGEKPTPGTEQIVDENLEVLAQMAELISGGGDFDLRLTDEFVKGARPGVGPELLERLSQGEFPVQHYLDLHGLGKEQALAEVEKFLTRCATKGLRHVLIVHGKGLRSPMGEPILKNALAKALSQKRMQKRVLAFCTAQPVDGGAGAMYVLLRKWSGPTGTYPRAWRP